MINVPRDVEWFPVHRGRLTMSETTIVIVLLGGILGVLWETHKAQLRHYKWLMVCAES